MCEITNVGFTYFGCTINILDRKDDSEAVEQDFSQRGDQLCGGHQDIHTVRPEKQTEEGGAGITSSLSMLISKKSGNKDNPYDKCVFSLTVWEFGIDSVTQQASL